MYIYLDNAATTPIDPLVTEAMLPVYGKIYGNPSSIHKPGREARSTVETARKNIAGMLNCSPSEIFFTSGGTESDNMALRCAVEAYNIKHIITSRLEHHAVLHPIEHLVHKGIVTVSYLKIEENGHIETDNLKRLLEKNPGSLVSLMHANNEIGNLLPLSDVGDVCSGHKALFHSDTVQSVCHYPIDLQKTKVDFITGSAHKFHGPKGAGFLFIRGSVKVPPLIYGGSQERNMRGGTENVAGIMGLAIAMEIAHQRMDEDAKRIGELKKYMITGLENELPGVDFIGDARGRSLYTILNVMLPETEDAEMLLLKLDIHGIAASAGSACTSGSNMPSHVIAALGKNIPNRPVIRFSFSRNNTKAEIDYVLGILKSFYPIHTEQRLNRLGSKKA